MGSAKHTFGGGSRLRLLTLSLSLVVAFAAALVAAPGRAWAADTYTVTIGAYKDENYTLGTDIDPAEVLRANDVEFGKVLHPTTFSFNEEAHRLQNISYTSSTSGMETVVYNASCTKNDTPPAPSVDSVTVSPGSLELVAGGATGTLTASVLPEGADQGVTWKSSDESVATVSDQGVVTPVAAGTATITATSVADASKSGTCAVTVSAPTHAVTAKVVPEGAGTVVLGAAEVAEGATAGIEATPAEGYEFERWTVDGAGAKIDDAASPKAKLTMGTADVTVTATFRKKEVAAPDASVTAHVQRIGWMDPVTDGTAAGTTGKSRRMEALTLKLPDGVAGGIEYRGHVQRSGWEKTWAADGNVAGTTGKSRRVEAVQIRLTGEAKDAYDVYYRVHVQRYGWMGWAKNGEEAGTQGMSRRAEAIQVVLVKQGDPAPAATYKGVTQQYAKAFVKK